MGKGVVPNNCKPDVPSVRTVEKVRPGTWDCLWLVPSGLAFKMLRV